MPDGPGPGDEVAAKMNTDENVWILATVCRYDQDSDSYQVADADDSSRAYEVHADQIAVLPQQEQLQYRRLGKGSRVVALYPDTTAFYLAVVSVASKSKRGSNTDSQHVTVQFDDDQDETGTIPHRPVPARFVIEHDLT